MEDTLSKIHAVRVMAEDEIERILLAHYESKGSSLNQEYLRYNMDVAIAATIVENKIKARGTSGPKPAGAQD